jgi:hypothetical protein
VILSSYHSIHSFVSNKPQGSKLKPDAPEFIPSRTNATPTSLAKANAKETMKEAAKGQKKHEKEDKKAAILAKKADKIEKKIEKLGSGQPSTHDSTQCLP